MKIITTVLLLLTLGVGALSAHRDVDVVVAPAGTSVVGEVTVDAVFAGVSTSDASALATVCVFIIVCCVLLVVARFIWRRGSSGAVLRIAPRGSPPQAMPVLLLLLSPSLSQLSISRT
ncbi:hypothetical protein ACPW96_21200 [Micromonospora sp. DT81.3]|uniref:hypothetical protein n=1 Tax=Micromonospora sp. DT81.3 TaxID=3416523 RepID=UPI003CF8704E